jgi:tetratricopeptide (TPR) repeat protein
MKDDESGISEDQGATSAQYLRAIKSQLRNNDHKEAFALLQQAAVLYPEDPYIISYFGCMQAIVEKKYRSGIEACKRALAMLKEKESFETELVIPNFYLNLGRAYLAASRKREALNAFKKGLSYDNGNGELQKELRDLGVRKHPPVPFLDRSNPINKYIGMLLRNSDSAG